MTLIEVLFAILVLMFGLWFVAALLPLGKLALMATEKSDRTGACGRAALRDIKIRGLAPPWQPSTAYAANAFVTPRSPNGHIYYCAAAGTSGTTEPTWPTDGSTVSGWTDLNGPFVVDPLGVFASLGGTFQLAAIKRINTPVTSTQALADSIFRWHDDWKFVLPEEDKSSSPAPAGTRPKAFLDSNSVPQYDGSVSWFFMVAPSLQSGSSTATVCAVVCYKRVLATTGETNYTATCDLGTSYGGVGISIPSNALTAEPPIKNDEWVLLYSTTAATPQCSWYRVVNAGYDGSNTRVTLVGPDWYGGTAANVVIVGGVTGVYTTTVQTNQ